jgi:dTDP-4-dehydrorhamnose 3,5-epimerase
MIFHKTKFDGVYLIEPELRSDERGWFARFFCQEEFQKAGIAFDIKQVNRSFTKQRGMLRGLHYQKEPKWESKVVSCLQGAIYDVVVDLREESPTFRQWEAFELSAENKKMLYTPKGFANGFQALTDNCELLYYMGEFYSPEHAAGLRYDDPTLNIMWPIPEPILSEKDRALPFLG